MDTTDHGDKEAKQEQDLLKLATYYTSYYEKLLESRRRFVLFFGAMLVVAASSCWICWHDWVVKLKMSRLVAGVALSSLVGILLAVSTGTVSDRIFGPSKYINHCNSVLGVYHLELCSARGDEKGIIGSSGGLVRLRLRAIPG